MHSNLSEEERLLLKSLGLLKAQRKVEVLAEHKLIKGIAKCKLCKTTTIQLIKMVKVGDGAWIKEEEVPLSSESDNTLPYEEYTTEVRLCWACKDELMKKEKEELVELIINLYNPVLSRQEIWKAVKKVKEEQKHEQ
jgi:site-specific recombinase XerD